MIYQHEVKEIIDFYDQYKDSEIVFSQEVINNMGLVQRDTSITLGDQVLKSVLISSTMEHFVFLTSLDEASEQILIDLGGALKVQLKFVPSTSSRSVLFTLDMKFLRLDREGLTRKELVFIHMKIKRKIPNDLIEFFSLYHINHERKLREKKKKVECFLLTNDRKTDCLIEKISKSELVLRMEDDAEGRIAPRQKALAILKLVKTGEVLEIIGNISSKSVGPNGSLSLTLSFDMDDQSPRFGYSIHVLRNIINS